MNLSAFAASSLGATPMLAWRSLPSLEMTHEHRLVDAVAPSALRSSLLGSQRKEYWYDWAVFHFCSSGQRWPPTHVRRRTSCAAGLSEEIP